MLNLSRVTFMANGKGQIQVENSQKRNDKIKTSQLKTILMDTPGVIAV